LPVTLKPFRCQDSLKRGEALVDVPVHEHVIVVGPVGNLDRGALKPGLDVVRWVRRPRMDSPREFLGGRGKNEDPHSIAWQKSRDGSCALPIDIENDVPAFSECGLDRLGRRSVQVPENLRPLQKVAA